MATIKAIEDRTIHQIQSGQVIVDLCSVVKELVENSLDAGATNIDVRFKNQGLDSIEVQDNGSGINPSNYDTVALKHYTSKLSTYSDLSSLETFGFRGEALSSLCALSEFTITTCLAADAPKGTRLDFEISGKVKGTNVVAAQKGTTVSVENLFHNLPVRRRELERNIKREWNRVVGLLGQYACIQKGVKISATQQTAAGKKATLFSTKGNATTRENIVNVFGAKTLTALLTLDLKLELEPTSAPSQRWSTQEDGGTKQIHIVGHISRPVHGGGRQTPDRQMFFVNGRPCGLPQVSKAFNEVYKQYNSHQSPFIFADIELDTHLYDVNVSPDKRTILLHDQSRMLEHLKESLVEMFDAVDYTVPISQLGGTKLPGYKQLSIMRTPTSIDKTTSTLAASNLRVSAASTLSAETDEEESTPLSHASGARQAVSSRQDSEADEEEDEESEGQGEEGNSEPAKRPTAVSRASLSRDAEATSLISKWLQNKTRDKPVAKAPNDKATADSDEGFSKSKRRLIEKFAKESEEQVHRDADPQDHEELPESSSKPTDRPAEPFVSHIEANDEDQENIATNEDAPIEEEQIPVIVSPPRRTLAAVPTGTIATRSTRAPLTEATITIGDHVVTTSMRSPFAGNVSVEKKFKAAHVAQNLPSFGSRFSQRFAVSGATQQTETDEEAESGAELEAASDFEMDSAPETGDSDEIEREMADQELDEDEEEVPSPQRSEVLITQALEEDEAEDVEVGSEDHSHDSIDGDYVDEEEKKVREDAKVAAMIKTAEDEASRPLEDNVKRATLILKGTPKRKDATYHLIRNVETSIAKLESQMKNLRAALKTYEDTGDLKEPEDDALESIHPEEKLSLTINKSDFASMKIVGQFNLGFILASRSTSKTSNTTIASTDDLFIIDQHASDEKYNFERLQATTIVQSQRLVHPKTLDLTAIEEEIVKENLSALQTNGFLVSVDESGDFPVGQRCQLLALPLSRETTFSLSDLEELISLLADQPSSTGTRDSEPGTGVGAGRAVVRPARVRTMFAMRACRSSVMIGKTLTHRQMGRLVRNMGEMEKPWNCPHGRPTMRHLCGLGAWDEVGWREGDRDSDDEDSGKGGRRGRTDWAGYIRRRREEVIRDGEEEDMLEERQDEDDDDNAGEDE